MKEAGYELDDFLKSWKKSNKNLTTYTLTIHVWKYFDEKSWKWKRTRKQISKSWKWKQ